MMCLTHEAVVTTHVDALCATNLTVLQIILSVKASPKQTRSQNPIPTPNLLTLRPGRRKSVTSRDICTTLSESSCYNTQFIRQEKVSDIQGHLHDFVRKAAVTIHIALGRKKSVTSTDICTTLSEEQL
jgi:hypothetical protein